MVVGFAVSTEAGCEVSMVVEYVEFTVAVFVVSMEVALGNLQRPIGREKEHSA